ncbi:MAG: hypothetical protein DIU84_09925 [Bacillota bacterium]|nr:MAG: hypothetical protein DIU84_09925 [Bacillota bacterium]
MKRSNSKSNVDWRRAVTIGVLTFFVAVAFAFPSGRATETLGLFPAVLTLLVIILVGIAFDIVGVAAAAADEKPFHAMAAARRPGARQAIWIVRNADAVVSFCNDVVGDVAGTLSGAAGAAIVVRVLALRPGLDETLMSVLMVGLVAALTVGGKAAGKGFALNQSTNIVYAAARVLYILEKAGLVRLQVRRSRRPARNAH